MFAIWEMLGWGTASIIAVGLACSLLAFVVGRLMLAGAKEPFDEPDPLDDARARDRAAARRSLSDPFIEGPSRERRCTFRRGGNPTQVAIGHPENPSELAQGVVVDRSTGGFCLDLASPLAVGAVVSVRPSVGTLIGTWVEAEVRHCSRERASWRVGLKFVRTPPLSVLWMFG